MYVHEAGVAAIAAPQVQALRDGDTITLGPASLTVWHTPGHSPDSVCFYVAAADSAEGAPLLISGDTLFVSKCGRTSEPFIMELYESLQRLKTLPAETVVYPGHDYGPTPTSTIGVECASNPYLTAPDLATFRERRLG